MHRIILSAVVLAFIGVCACFSDAFAITLYGTAYLGPSGLATLYTIDSTTGIGTPVGLTGYDRVGAIDFNPSSGILYGIGTDPTSGMVDLITINTMTGVGSTVGATGLTSGSFQDISFRSDGTLFGVAGGTAYTINLTTGVASALGAGTSLGSFGSALAFDPSNTLYNINGATVGTINQTTGAGTPTGTTVNYPLDLLNPRPNAMDYDLTSGILYASVVHGLSGGAATSIDGVPLATNFIAQIDVATGNVTGVFATVNGLDGLAVTPTAPTSVPDALSTLWLALPLCGLFAVARLRPSYSVALNRPGRAS